MAYPVTPVVMTRARILKNVLVLSSGVLVLFMAFDGLTMLQSTMNARKGLGVASQAVLYFCFCISALVFPKYVIKRLGSKTTLLLSMASYVPYVASNFHPTWGSMMPASVLVGLGSAMLWGAQANYLNDVSVMFVDQGHSSGGTEQLEAASDEKGEAGEICRCVSCVHIECDAHEILNNPLAKENRGFHSSQASLAADAADIRNPLASSECRNSGILNSNDIISKTTSDKNSKFTHDGSINISKMEENSKDNKLPAETIDCSEKRKETNIKNENGDKNKSIDIVKNEIKVSSSKQRSSTRAKSIESTTARFFGFHGLFFLSSSVWSNLMSYAVLHSGQTSTFALTNATTQCACGAQFCSQSMCSSEQAAQPSDATRYALTGACVALGVASVLLVATFLDPLDDQTREKFSLRLMSATLSLARQGRLLLLMPLSFYLGMAKGFYTADYTKAFVGCAWGTPRVGLVTACYGGACALSSLASGWLVRRVGRTPLFAFGAVANVAASVLLLAWTPDPRDPVMFFVVAGLWGCHGGTVWSQLRAFYGVLYKSDEEAAFGTFHMWYSLGFGLSFAYSEFLCTALKVYVLVAAQCVGYAGYFVVEWRHARNK